MTYLHNAPEDFAAQAADGVALAHPHLVRRVDAGLISARSHEHRRVAVIVGGGSGHFPAFGGMVGDGLADGAVLGNTFASPSASQIVAVAARVDRGAGVVLMYGNYTGDVLHFTEAARLLQQQGIPARTVAVTDDIASAPAAERDRRRGVAGDLVVFKAAAAASAAGADLDEVVAAATRANDATRTLGVAFGACTLPGESAPLFELDAASMAIGMGIHGEPGLATGERVEAEVLVNDVLGRLLADHPTPLPTEVVTIVNGLGGISPDELYVANRALALSLRDRGISVREALVGTYCSSFAMPGFSVTLFTPDDLTRPLWDAPVQTVGWARPHLTPSTPADIRSHPESHSRPQADSDFSEMDGARRLSVEAMASIADALQAAAEELGRLDAAVGDGDHGIGMARGSAAAARAARLAAHAQQPLSAILHAAADGWSDAAGGTSGAIWARMIHEVADSLGDDPAVDTATIAATATRAAEAAMSLGGAQPGDKTMIDAVVPFAEALRTSDAELTLAWAHAVARAAEAAESTRHLVAHRGRSRSHGEASIGHVDPGAVSFALVMDALSSHLSPTTTGQRP